MKNIGTGKKETRVITVGQLSPEDLAALKAEYKNILIVKLTVRSEDKEEPVEGSDKPHCFTEVEESYGYLRKYKRQHIERAYSISSTEGLLAAGRFLLDELWIKGDTRQISNEDEDVDVAISAQNEAGSYVKFFPGEIKNY